MNNSNVCTKSPVSFVLTSNTVTISSTQTHFMKKTTLLSFMAVWLWCFPLHAQQDTLDNKGYLSISGYVDVGYQYNFNEPKSSMNGGRIFDLYHNQFSLGLVQTVVTYTKGRLTGVADLTVGPNADLANFGNEGTAKIIKQAYVSYAFTDKVALTVGQYGTHIGYELIDAPLNFNYSLSHLFGNGPFYHTGAKLNFNLNEKVGVMVGVVNGWDALVDYNDKKSLTAQVALNPFEGLDMYLNWIGGDEYGGGSAFGDTKGSFASLFDLALSYNATEAFLIGLNAAYGSFKSGEGEPVMGDVYSHDADWWGAALYLHYNATERFGVGLRGEHFSDPEGVRYNGPLEVTALTLTGNIKLADGNFLIKPELRADFSKDNFFEDSEGNFVKDSQITMGLAFIYAF